MVNTDHRVEFDFQHRRMPEHMYKAKANQASSDGEGRDHSVLRNIPVELLLEIFWAYVHDLSDDNAESPHPPRRNSGSPVLLSHVSSFWRSIVNSSPTLWSNITLDDGLPEYSQRLMHYASRSGSVPITLRMKICRAPSLADRKGTAHHWDACALAISLLPRCRHAYLDINWALEHALVAKLPPPSSPPNLLSTLDVRLPGWSSRNALRFSAYLHRSPRLTSVNWKGLYTHSNGRVTQSLLGDLPMDSLRSITLGDFHSYEDLVPALRQCQRLVSLDVYICKPSSIWTTSVTTMIALAGGPTPGPTEPLTLTHLHTLSLHTLSSLTHVFATLCLPSLTSLSLQHFWDMSGLHDLTSVHHHHANVGWDALREMLERSGCKLRSLEYTRYGDGCNAEFVVPPVNEAAVVRALASPAMRWLRSLNFAGRVGDALLSALILPPTAAGNDPGNGRVLPSLEDLTVNECWSTDGVWSDLVLSRSTGRINSSSVKGEVASLKSARVLLRGSSQSNFSRDLTLALPGTDVAVQWSR